MPCYDPPEHNPQVFDLAQQAMRLQAREQRYVVTLKEIEAACKDPRWVEHTGDRLASNILDIIDSHWRSP
jgi:hypothetical protein